MEKFAGFAVPGRQIVTCALVFQRVSIHSEQIQRFHNYGVMRASHGITGEKRMTRVKLCADWGVTAHLIGVLRTHA